MRRRAYYRDRKIQRHPHRVPGARPPPAKVGIPPVHVRRDDDEYHRHHKRKLPHDRLREPALSSRRVSTGGPYVA